MSQALALSSSQIALIRRTVAKDTNETEFDLFIEMCRARGLNPLLRHAFAQVYNKEPRLDKKGKPYANQKERQLVIVVSREGQRFLAEKTKAYRPDEQAPRFIFDDAIKNAKTNPAGLVSAEVSVFKFTHGEWHRVTEVAYWEEYAPLTEIWEGTGEERRGTGVFELQKGKDGWRKMPRIMLSKCFSGDTEVLTSSGFQKFSELSAPVMQVTDAGLEPVSVQAIAQPYDGEMITLDSDDLNFCVTPNHDMVTTGGMIEAQLLYEQARTRPVHFIPRSASGRQIDADISDEALVLAAAYLSDGYDRSGLSFVISVSRAKKVARLRSLGLHGVERNEISAGTVSKTQGRDIVTKTDKTVFAYKHAAMHGLCLPNKKVDSEMLLSLSQRQARIFVEAWIDFDGTVTSSGVQRFYTSNPYLLGVFELAACLAGKSVSRRRERTSDISKRPNYHLSVSDRDAIPVIRWGRSYHNLSNDNDSNRNGLKITKNADGIVWCVSVPSGKIIVRRNGFSMICGNCAEMAALRKAFPDDFAGLYDEAELDRGNILDLSPSDIADNAERKNRLELVGVTGQSLIIDWMDGNALRRVTVGRFYDEAMAFLRTCEANPSAANAWKDRNRHALQEFWALDKPAALSLKQRLEAIAKLDVVEIAVDEPKAPEAKPENPAEKKLILPPLKLREAPA